jgi:ribosomal protein L37AE/L43A
MGIDEKKKKNEILSRIAADLFDQSKGGGDLSSKIHRLRDEIKKVIENENTIFGKIRQLVESFREIIPEEKQRYNAAIKALSTTSKLSQQEIVKAVNNQLEELKILEKGLMSAPAGWSGELKIMEAKLQEMRDEISKLREKIGRLESEEKEILNGTAARKKEMDLIEKAVGELFADIGAEITFIKKKVEEFTTESTASQPVSSRHYIKSDILSEEKTGEQKKEILESSAPQDTEWQKKCPMCGGRMDLYSLEGMWRCYSCAYEELKKDEVQGKSEDKAENANELKPAPASESILDSSPPLAVPLADMSNNEYEKSKKGSSPSNSQPSLKKKTCPVCRKKMNWYEIEKTWRCPFCQYERSI